MRSESRYGASPRVSGERVAERRVRGRSGSQPLMRPSGTFSPHAGRRATLPFAIVLLLLACAKAPAPPAEPPPNTGPRVVFPDGYAVHVEVAADAETRAQGLMFRDRLREHTGMLFIFPTAGVYPFWMKNTLIPLDMVWIDDQKRVAHVKFDVPPCKADPCPSYDPEVPALYVLEVAAGVAREHKIAAGSTLRFEGLENFVAR